MKTATSIIIAALILLCLWQFFDGQSTKKELEDKYHASMALWKAEAVEYNRQGQKQDSANAALKQAIADTVHHFSGLLAKQHKASTRVRDKIKPVDTVLLAQDTALTRDQLMYRDSLISYQDSTISILYAERAAVKVNTDALVGNLETRARISDEEANKWIGRWQESEALRQEDQKKMRRQRRLERVIEGAIVVVVILVAI